MENEKVMAKPIASIISFVTGLISCACAPMCILAGFMWMVSGYTLASTARDNMDLFFRIMTYSPYIGLVMSFIGCVAFIIGMIRHEDMKWLRVVGLLMCVATIPIHFLGLFLFMNGLGVRPIA